MSKIKTYAAFHTRACLFSLGRLLRKPVNTFLTVAVIGIAMALPASLYMLSLNFQGVTTGWSKNTTQIALYLKTDLSETRIQDVVRQLKMNPQVTNVTYISPQQGLEDFGKVIGSKTALSSLHENPLPGVIMVQPILSLRSPIEITQMVSSLQAFPEVSSAKLNMQWLQRFNSILNLIQSGITILGILLALGVLLIIGNTIRLATQNDQREISVLKLVGATDAFVRRPFLYTGFWYGLFGGVFAWLIVNIVLWWLRAPAAQVASAYSSSFYLSSLSANTGLHLIIATILLGLIGAWLTVTRHLKINF